jgi:hypothetical protein
VNPCYRDIYELTDANIQWFDENAVPRFCKFAPRHTANIYAQECALAVIKCAACGCLFTVAFSYHDTQRMMLGLAPWPVHHRITERSLAYGDPPNVECCGAGPTMQADTVQVLEYWERVNREWKRNAQFEIHF